MSSELSSLNGEKISITELYDNDYNYLHTQVIYRQDGNYYTASTTIRMLHSESIDVMELKGERIPVERIYPPIPPEVSEPLKASMHLPEDTFIKTVKLGSWSPGCNERALGDQLLKELLVLEKLRLHPHPNICEYRGCITNEEGLLTGLCFKKYSYDLGEAVYRKLPFDTKTILSDYRNAVEHIHSLGLVHNDISCCNLMIDDKGKGVLIDFGECTEKGASTQAETPFWSRRSGIRQADGDDDLYGLQRAERWIEDNGQGPEWGFCIDADGQGEESGNDDDREDLGDENADGTDNEYQEHSVREDP